MGSVPTESDGHDVPETVHRYTTTCAWHGSTLVGYDAYDRRHEAAAPPAEDGVELSADPAFGGDRRRLIGQDPPALPDSAGKRNGPFAEAGSDVDRDRARLQKG